MIEVPAAALASRPLAREADFISVGTNDLSQYGLAVDRNNSRVANLYQPLHPGLVVLVRSVIEGCAAEHTSVSVCGEMAGDPQAALLLIGLGLRSLSMSPFHMPIVRKLLSVVTVDEAQTIAREVSELGTTTEITRVLRDHTLRLVPDLSALLPEPREP